MWYLLDAKVVIALLKNEPAIFRKRLRRAFSRGATIGVSARVSGLPRQDWTAKAWGDRPACAR